MSIHRLFGSAVLVVGVLTAPLHAQRRVPPEFRPQAPSVAPVIPRLTAVPDTLLAPDATATAQIRDARPSERPHSPVPRVHFEGDASLAARGLAGPTLNGVAAVVPLTTQSGLLTPYVSGGLVGRRWYQAPSARATGDGIGALPLVLERSALADQLVENDFSRFFGVGIAGRIGPLLLSMEVRQVRTGRVDGAQALIRGQIPLKLPF